MKKISLNGKWNLSGADYDCTGSIPGSVLSILLENELIDNPYYRDNELNTLKLMDYDYTFSRVFTFEDVPEKVFLCCNGIDTLCTVFINGQKVADTNNMHRSYKFEISDLLQENNTIQLKFSSTTEYINKMDKDYHRGGSYESMRGFPYLRKAHCMFGWDWGPRIPDMGIFRDIYLLVENSAYIEDVLISQRHENGLVSIKPCVKVCGDANLKIVVTKPDGKIFEAEANTENEIKNPQLWWPNGFGDQPLYKIDFLLFENEIMVDSISKKIGLRTMSMNTDKDMWGEKFAHVINDVEFFAMGADYIPEDNILSRMSYERTYSLLKQCKECNYNVIRVWGGGFYPSDYFYDICDELGLVVWQDLMFACANYPADECFKQNVIAEIKDNVIRIRHHACLGLWCGNNEMEMFASQYEYEGDESTKSEYYELFEKTIPPIVKEYDPYTFYWKASPSSGGNFDEPNSENRGDTHYWEVWHGNKPFCEYRKHFFRYASEFGFQSFPGIETVKSFTLPEDRNIFSRIFEMHQRNGSANGKIMSYLAATFLYPSSFENVLYASQLLQAFAIKYGVEHFRRNRGRCMGAVYWQLNDIWPTASWSSIDYFGRYKALQYFAKQFFSPVLISCEEIGETTKRNAVSDQPSQIETSARLNVTNETMQNICGNVTWQLRNSQGEILTNGEQILSVNKLSSEWLDKIDFECTDYKNNYLSFQFSINENIVSEDCVLFTAPKHYNFVDPHLKADIIGDEIVVSADAFAYCVMIECDCDVVLSDNYFSLNSNSRTVRIVSGDPKEVTVKSVYNIR